MSDSERSLEQQFKDYAVDVRLKELVEECMDIPQAVTAISKSLDLADKIRKLAIKANNIELIEAIAELRLELAQSKNALADVTQEVSELKQENDKLKQQIKDLTKQDVNQLRYAEGFYYKDNKPDPYCPQCYEKKQESLLSARKSISGRIFQCKTCTWEKEISDDFLPPSYRAIEK